MYSIGMMCPCLTLCYVVYIVGLVVCFFELGPDPYYVQYCSKPDVWFCLLDDDDRTCIGKPFTSECKGDSVFMHTARLDPARVWWYVGYSLVPICILVAIGMIAELIDKSRKKKRVQQELREERAVLAKRYEEAAKAIKEIRDKQQKEFEPYCLQKRH
jgi:hypothetical protein